MDIEDDNEKSDPFSNNDNAFDSEDEFEENGTALLKINEKEQPLYVLPLYSVLPPDKQQLVKYIYV